MTKSHIHSLSVRACVCVSESHQDQGIHYVGEHGQATETESHNVLTS